MKVTHLSLFKQMLLLKPLSTPFELDQQLKILMFNGMIKGYKTNQIPRSVELNNFMSGVSCKNIIDKVIKLAKQTGEAPCLKMPVLVTLHNNVQVGIFYNDGSTQLTKIYALMTSGNLLYIDFEKGTVKQV